MRSNFSPAKLSRFIPARPQTAHADGPSSPTGSNPFPPSKPAPKEKHLLTARDFFTALRVSRRLRIVAIFAAGALFGASYPMWQLHTVRGHLTTLQSTDAQSYKDLSARVDTFASSCVATNTCRSFPTEQAVEVLQRQATNCLTFTQGTSSTPLLEGGASTGCGWEGDGTGTPESVIPDARYSQPVHGSTTSIGVVGVSVRMIGQPDYLTYVAAVQRNAKGVLAVAAPGAFYTAPPTLLITKCNTDSTVDTAPILARFRSLEAGRINTPNIDPQDFVVPQLQIGRYSKSITGVDVQDVTVCQSPASARVVLVTEQLSGPVPGSHFTFTNGYTITAGSRWLVSGWGPTTVQP